LVTACGAVYELENYTQSSVCKDVTLYVPKIKQ
jgi:hypothetical protein